MNRQKGVWITIICILVIGVSVTKMTSRFVSSSTLATMEAEDDAFLPRIAGGPETAQRAADAEETMAAEAAAGFAAPAERGAGVAPRAAMAEAGAADRAAPAAEDAPLQAAPASGQAGEDTAAAVLETVKSPLDPTGIVPGQNYAAVEGANENSKVTSYTAEDYEERLDQTAAQIVQYRDASAGSNGGTAYIAAEYELGVWDNELNTLYTLIRSRMDDAEREDLKQEELDWMKDRDAAADRAAARAGGQTSKSTAYTEAAASKTKERCYELVEDYGDVIDRDFEEIKEYSIKAVGD